VVARGERYTFQRQMTSRRGAGGAWERWASQVRGEPITVISGRQWIAGRIAGADREVSWMRSAGRAGDSRGQGASTPQPQVSYGAAQAAGAAGEVEAGLLQQHPASAVAN